jgi:hypothetical protein
MKGVFEHEDWREPGLWLRAKGILRLLHHCLEKLFTHPLTESYVASVANDDNFDPAQRVIVNTVMDLRRTRATLWNAFSDTSAKVDTLTNFLVDERFQDRFTFLFNDDTTAQPNIRRIPSTFLRENTDYRHDTTPDPPSPNLAPTSPALSEPPPLYESTAPNTPEPSPPPRILRRQPSVILELPAEEVEEEATQLFLRVINPETIEEHTISESEPVRIPAPRVQDLPSAHTRPQLARRQAGTPLHRVIDLTTPSPPPPETPPRRVTSPVITAIDDPIARRTLANESFPCSYCQSTTHRFVDCPLFPHGTHIC